MFGRHGRLPIDLLLGTGQSDGARSTSEWVRQHHQWLHSDYQWVTKHLAVTAAKTKCLYNRTARDCPLLPGERVLVWDNRWKGKGKLSHRWEPTPVGHCGPDLPVYTVQPEGKPGHEHVQNRNLLWTCPNSPTVAGERQANPEAPPRPLMGWALVLVGPEPAVEGGTPPPQPRCYQWDTQCMPPKRYGNWTS